MCTLALYLRIFDDHPLVVAANRDEFYDRPSAPPALLGSNPTILAGKDLLAGGTWLGVNEYGVLVGILNRRSNAENSHRDSLRSRGLLCLDVLRCESAWRASEFLSGHHGSQYQPFTLVFADTEAAWVAFNAEERIELAELNVGLHVFSNASVDDARLEKINHARERFARLINDDTQDLRTPSQRIPSFQKVLSDHTIANIGKDTKNAICVHAESSGTVSSSIIFYSQIDRRFQTFYCPGPPCQFSFSESCHLTVR